MITVFTCGSHRERCSKPGCTEPTDLRCEFALGGRRTGQKCDKAVCAVHSRVVDGRRMCDPHYQVLARRPPR